MNHSRKLCSGLFYRKSVLWQQTTVRTKFQFFKDYEFGRETVLKMGQPIDLTFKGIANTMNKRNRERLRKSFQYDKEAVKTLGVELAVAHWVVGRGGAVKLEGVESWLELDENRKCPRLPTMKVPHLFVEGIDCSNMPLIYDSFDSFEHLSKLKYLNLSGCQEVDDWCMDRIVILRDSLLHLDLTSCNNVSERGLASLHKLRKLRCLQIGNMRLVPKPQLISIMLEEALPHCEVIGVDFDVEASPLVEETTATPDFISSTLKRIDDIEEAKRLEDEELFPENNKRIAGKPNT